MTPPYQPGDLFLFHGTGLLDRIVQDGTGSDWNHCGMLVAPDGGVVEALSTGVVRGTIAKYAGAGDAADPAVRADRGRPSLLVLSCGLTAERRAIAVAYALSRVGDRYSWPTIFGIALSRLTGMRLAIGVTGEDICSGMLGEAYERAAIDFTADGAGLSPADLAAYFRAPSP